jgi:hypothetical protein
MKKPGDPWLGIMTFVNISDNTLPGIAKYRIVRILKLSFSSY